MKNKVGFYREEKVFLYKTSTQKLFRVTAPGEIKKKQPAKILCGETLL